MNRKRLRDWGIVIGELPTGPRNKLSDVPGVTVGHATVADGGHNTGLTVIFPASGNLYADKLIAASHIINGYGKTAGSIQLDELGTLETPIALTGTLNVGKVSDALVAYTMAECDRDGVACRSVNPVVGETNDAVLNRLADRPVGAAELAAAIADAGADFDEGDVGAGRGTMCMGLKGGIGSASRIVTVGGQHFTLGALVQTNFGRLDDLLVAGYPAGAAIRRIVSAPPAPEDKGSCMIIIGTDLPVSHRQLSRILRRAAVGLVRTGSFVGHGSGDVVLGFTTANRLCREEDDLRQVTLLREEALDGAFRAAAESVEEAILNSLCTADRVTATGMGAAGNETVTLAGFSEFLPALLPALCGRG